MHMLRRQVVLLAAAVLVLLAARLDAAEQVGTFAKVEGNVDVLRLSDVAALKVQAGDPVHRGDAIRTKRNGKAEIRFQDDTVLQLAPETRITIDEYTYRGDAREKGLIGLLRGKVRAIISKLKAAVVPVTRTDANFNVRTPTAIAGVKGTDLIVYFERGVTGVIFIEGEGFLYNPKRPDRVVPVRGGQASFVLSESEPPLEAQPVADSFVAPHLKDMPGSNLETVTPAPDTPVAGQPPTVSVVITNTTYGALTDAVLGGGGGFALPPAATGPLVIGDPVGITPGPPGGTSTLVPITQTYPALMPTPVSLSVTIP